MGDNGRQEVRERVWVEKVDKTGPEPKVVGVTFAEQRRVIHPDGRVTVETRVEEQGPETDR